MRRLLLALSIAALLIVQTNFLEAQSADAEPGHAGCSMHTQHSASDAHHAVVEEHGDQAMGFPHDKTTHHFRLTEEGGAIEVTANEPADKVNVEAIRSHLAHIAIMFQDGNFSTPMLVHDSIPPGVTTMKLLQGRVHFTYEVIDAGGRVRIESSDPVAVAAVHDFLRFQITDHQTGDSLSAEAH